MAQKNKPSQAERAAAGANKASTAAKKKTVPTNIQDPEAIPIRIILAVLCLGFLLLHFLVLCKVDGVLLNWTGSLIMGLIGKTGFLMAIPAFLFLFVVLAFSGKRPVVMRCVSMLLFVFAIGCISHLLSNPADLGKGLRVVGNLYTGGSQGTTGGVICGLVAMGFAKFLSVPLSYIIFILTAVLSILACFDITIPSIARAIANRPRAEWEDDDEDEDERPEPAAVVVNHLATKRIEHLENRRRRWEEEDNQDDADIDIPLDGDGRKPRRKKRKGNSGTDMIDQIADIDTPVGLPVAVEEQPAVPARKKKAQTVAPAAVQSDEEGLDEDFEPLIWKHSQGEPAANMPVPRDPVLDQVTRQEARASAIKVAEEIAQSEATEKPIYCYPPISLLKPAKKSGAAGIAEMEENTRRLNEALASFKIEAHIINVTRGPSVTRYEAELEKGVRLSKLTTVADDIALSLGASGVRIAAIPDKISVVGIEVPNRTVTPVTLREVVDSAEFARAKSKSTFAVGKDIGGACIVGNIAKLPHMLIAGTTGSGKSVCMNSLIVSLLYKASPDDVKLIMVDPKMVELGIYNGIPHLLIPVVTDPKKAAGSLQWAVTEMMRRYKSMSDAGVRDLESYNSIVEGEGGSKLPQIVVIIDELADLMLVAAKEVEESICRIAQMGRAAGIHLVIATQRPSADVITGLMKANIPSRIAFAVASAMESRIILDTQGAEKLVGRGDMLFAPVGNGKPLRVQGCFVDDSEVEAVANYVKENYITNYDQTVMEEIEKTAAQTGTKNAPQTPEPQSNADEDAGDEMLPEAVEVILETGQASVSMLQRRLKLGYARAARIVDEMEEKGIVGPFKGAKPREILITREQWEAMKGGSAATSDATPMEGDVPEDTVL